MDAIETAIRNAFEKGDSEDPAFREKVYRSALAALDRALQAQPELTLETAIMRRRHLQTRIVSIESEFQPAVAAQEATPEEGAAPEISVGPRSGPAAAPFVESPKRASPSPSGAQMAPPPPVHARSPVAEVGTAAGVRIDPPVTASNQVASPSLEIGAERDQAPAAISSLDSATPRGREIRPAKRRRPFAGLLVLLILLGGLGYGGLWAYRNGFVTLPPDIQAWLDSPRQAVAVEDAGSEDTAPATSASPSEADAQRNWVTVFTPEEASLVRAPSGAVAEVSQDESGSFLRIRSGTTGAAVIFDVGQGVLEQIAGKRAVFDIITRAADGKETQISVDCDFAELGDCGRRRYDVGYERAEYLFDVELPQKKPGTSGSISINSDFANEGKAVDIYEIRVSVSQ